MLCFEIADVMMKVVVFIFLAVVWKGMDMSLFLNQKSIFDPVNGYKKT